MNTAILYSEGDLVNGAIEWKGSYLDPVSRSLKTTRSKMIITDGDHHTFEMWEKNPAGGEYRSLLIDYTRKIS